MQIHTSGAARAFLLGALPLSAIALSAVAASAQGTKSSVTSFDKQGNTKTYEIPTDEGRSSILSVDDNDRPVIQYTSPPLNPSGIQRPQSIAGLLANQNIYGQSAPNPAPGNYTRFGYTNGPIYPPGYGYPAPVYPYGYPAPAYPFPAQGGAYSVPLGGSEITGAPSTTITSIPLGTNYSFPGYGYPVPAYPAPIYPYPAPIYPYGYPAPAYPYGFGNGGFFNGGFGNGTFASNTANYGISFGRGGFNASIGGSNTTSTSRSTITIR